MKTLPGVVVVALFIGCTPEVAVCDADGGMQVTCGSGTTLVGTQCVSANPIVTCGAGGDGLTVCG